MVHDACVFALPSQEQQFNFKTSVWQKFINSENMQDTEFKLLLANAPDIEQFIQTYPKKKPSDAEQKDKKDKLGEAVKAVQRITQEYKKIRKKRVESLGTTAEENTLYTQYSTNLLQAQLNLVEASAALGNKLDRLSILELKAYSAKYNSQAKPEFKYFLDHGLTKNDYAKFVKLKRVDNDTAIPPVVIDGQAIGHPGYYLRRLNVAHSDDAAVAACLGKLTHCCQSLSGEAGEACTIHGLTSPEGGFYVVCKGDINNPKPLKDPVVFQSWVWRSRSNGVVFDSVERSPDINADIAKAFYYELSYQLVKNYQVPKICCGRNSGISKSLEIDPTSRIPSGEIPKDYNGYRDSHSQFMVCGRDALYLLPGKEEEFFKQCADEKLTAEHPILIKMIDFAIKGGKKEPLKSYKEGLLGKYQQIFDHQGQTIIDRCRIYLQAYQKANYDLAVSMVCETPYLLAIKDNIRGNLLHCLTENNPESLRRILTLLPEQDRLEVVKEKNRNSSTALHCAAGNPESLRQILTLLPEPNRLEAVKEKDENGSTVLHCVAGNPESLRQILTLLPEPNRLEAVKEKDKDDYTVLHRTAKNPESLRQILALYPESNRLEAVKEKDKFGRTVLYESAGNPESLRQILVLYPESSRLEAVKEKDLFGDSVLHLAAKNLESLRQVLTLLPEENRLEAVKEKDRLGNSILHQAADNPELLKQILVLLPVRISSLFVQHESENSIRNTIRLLETFEEAKVVKDQPIESQNQKDLGWAFKQGSGSEQHSEKDKARPVPRKPGMLGNSEG